MRSYAVFALLLIWLCTPVPTHAQERWQHAGTRWASISALAFAHDRPFLYVSFSYYGQRRWQLAPSAIVGVDLETGKVVPDILPCGTTADRPVESPDGSYLAFASFHERKAAIKVRRRVDRQIVVVPDSAKGEKTPHFFSADSKILYYTRNIDLEETLIGYNIETGAFTAHPLGLRYAGRLQRLTGDRILMMGHGPVDESILTPLAARTKSRHYSLTANILIYNYDMSTRRLTVDSVNFLAPYWPKARDYRFFNHVWAIAENRYYVVDHYVGSLDTLFPPRGAPVITTLYLFDGASLKQVEILHDRFVMTGRISQDEKWLAYGNSIERAGELNDELEIKNLSTGQTRRFDLFDAPFDGVAYKQQFGCSAAGAAQ
jgi:hypothetical protein